jgi:hypothetical protein
VLCAQVHKPLDPLVLGLTFPPTPPKNTPPKPLTRVMATHATHLCAPDPRIPIAAFVMPLESMRRM